MIYIGVIVMKYKKHMIIFLAALFLFTMATASASDSNDTAVAVEDTDQMELSVGNEIIANNLKTSEKNDTLTQTGEDKLVSLQTDFLALNDGIDYNSRLSNGIASKEDIDLDIIIYDEIYPDEVECIVYASRDGEYNLTIGDFSTIITVKNNISYYECGTLEIGTYLATVSFKEDNKYNPAANMTVFAVYQIGTLFEIETNNSQFAYAETPIITNTLEDNAMGTIKYYLSNGTFLGEFDVSENFILPVINIGDYVIIGKYSGDMHHIPATDSIFISVKPNNTFWALNHTINGNDNPVIELSNDYYFDSVYDADFVDGIVINRPVTIKGNGYTIDAKGKSRIFHVTSGAINITNVTLKNGKADTGGAIYFENDISNSNINATYINNTATRGGANYFWGSVLGSNVSGTFINNTATNGGANFFDCEVSTSNISGTYANNTAEQDGGANNFYSVSTSNISGTYINNTAEWYGGANYFDREVSGSNISGTYINNTASNAVIYFEDDFNYGLDANITNAIFLNNNCIYEIYARIPSDIRVKDSWFGNNASNYMNKPNINDKVTVDNWLFLNATADPSSLLILDSSNVTFKLYSTDGTNVSDFDNSRLPAVNLTLTATNGDVEKTTTLDNIVKYVATEHGKGSVTAKIENASYTIYFNNILRDVDLSVSAQNITYLENEILTLTYNDTATGKVNITLKSKNYKKTIEGDINRTITIADLPAGEYDVTIEYSGDNVFSNATSSAYFTVEKRTTEVIPDKKTIGLFVDDKSNITYTLSPDYALGNVSFSSNDTNIASVDSLSGDIMANAEGSATITVSFSGSENYTASNATVIVNVKKIPTQITVNSSDMDMKVNGEKDVGAGLEPANAGNLTYKSSDEDIVIVENGKIKGLKEGNATITVDFAGDKKYATAENKTIAVNVRLNDASVSVNNATLDLFVDDTFNLIAGTVPEGLNVTYVPDNSGVVSVDNKGVVTALKEGTANITVKVGGDGVYAENSTTVSVNVKKIPTEITVDTASLDLFVGDETVIVAALTPADAGNVTFTSSNEDVVIVDEKGNVIANEKGQAIITVSYAGDDKYAAADNKTITVNVSLNDASVTVDNDTLDLKVDETCAINATKHPDTILLDIAYTSSNSSVASVDEKGIVTAVGEGTAIITVEVGDDEIYAKNSTAVTVTVSKIPVEIIIQNTTVDMVVDDIFDPVVSLMPSNAGRLSFRSSNDTVVLINGHGMIKAVGEGNATVTVAFDGNEKYAAVSRNITVSVSKQDANINVSMPENVTVGENSTVNVILPDDATGNVTVNVDGEVVDTVAVTDGSAEVTIPSLSAGNHTVEIAYLGDDKYNSASKTATITVNKYSTNITAADVTATYKVNKYLVINLTDSKGNPLANSTVTVELSTAKNYTSDENGQIKVKVSNLVPKTYTAKITFKGDDNYVGSNTTAEVTVKKATAKITAKAKTFKTTTKTKKYTVMLKANGEALKNKWVYLKVNGKTYKAKTNSKGKATFKITQLNKAGKFKAAVTFKGNDYYKKATKKATIKVKSVWKTVQKGSKNSAIVKKIQRALKNHGYYLEYNGRYLMVDGIFWDYTEMAVREFQNDKTLKVTGKVDEKTAKKLGII